MSALSRDDGWCEERPESSDLAQSKPLAVIETDLFCRTCGYNLHKQRVWRDARLGVMVCRCPECGMHEAADVASGIGNMWSRQFGQFILAVWVCLIAVGTCWVVSSFSAAQFEFMAQNRSTISESSEHWAAQMLSLGCEVVAGFWIAATISIMLLHRKRTWGYLSVAIPLVAVAWTLATQTARHPRYAVDNWETLLLLSQFVCYQLSGFLLGAALGRSCIRQIAAWALPAWAIRALAFLWLVEGKELPAQARK